MSDKYCSFIYIFYDAEFLRFLCTIRLLGIVHQTFFATRWFVHQITWEVVLGLISITSNFHV